MLFYHGTNEVIGGIDFLKSRLRTDFGRGFYLSSEFDTARDWAMGKAGFSGVATVMRYEICDSLFNDDALNYKKFAAPSIEWLDFISDNRQRNIGKKGLKEPRHYFDVVTGPIANDKVADVVDMYCKGKLTAEKAIEGVKALPSVIQMSFHTIQAFKHIQSVTYSQLEKSKWSKWRLINETPRQ